MKKILVVSHCILNNASKVYQDERELADEYVLRDRLLRDVFDSGIQLIQLPCPEFMIYGSRRWGHVRDQFMHPHFRKESAAMLAPVIDQLEEYMSYPDEYKVIGIVAVEGSPSCGWHQTCRGEWRGEVSFGPASLEDGPGVFMEILTLELERRGLDIPVLSMEDAIGIVGNYYQKEVSK